MKDRNSCSCVCAFKGFFCLRFHQESDQESLRNLREEMIRKVCEEMFVSPFSLPPGELVK
jgi:hypothetical protein